MNIYIAGPMRGYPHFNFPTFFEVATMLREEGHEVFSPAERDVKEHGDQIYSSLTGDLNDIKHLGFSLRAAMAADTNYICTQANRIAMLPGWEKSSGARAEHALAIALDIPITYIKYNMAEDKYEW